MSSDNNPVLVSLKALRSLRTRKINRVKSRLEAISSSAETLSDTIGESDFEVQLAVIEKLVREIIDLGSQILRHPDLPESDAESECDTIDKFEDETDPLLARLRLKLQREVPTDPSMLHHSGNSSIPIRHQVRFQAPETPTEETVECSNPPIVYKAAKEIDVAPEKFKGDRLKFRQFKTQFDYWISRQPTAPSSVKLMILKKQLEGDPKELVENLELTDDNYNIAWDLLEKNFARVDTERERIMAELRHLRPHMAHPYDTSSLRKLLNVVQINTQILESMGLPLSQTAPFVKSSLEAALPAKIRQEFKDHLRMDRRFESQHSIGTPQHAAATPSLGDEMTEEVQKLIQFLRQRLIDLDDSKHVDALRSDNRQSEDGQRKNQNGRKDTSRKFMPTQTMAAVSGANQDQKLRPRPCLFCNTTEHNSSRCPAHLSYADRCNTLRRLKRCVRCFRPQHTNPNDCKGPRMPCNKCQSKRHYTSMHQANLSEPISATPDNVVAGLACRDNTLLMTVTAHIVNAGAKIPIRLFLDQGSALTFISPSVRRLLPNEAPVQRAELKVKGFTGMQKFTSDKYQIRLRSTYNDHTMEFLAYEHEFDVNPENSCSPQVSKVLRKFNKEHRLADMSLIDGRKPPPIAMLIGSDQIFKVLFPRVPEVLAGNIWAHETRCGWTISGPGSKTPSTQNTVVSAVHVVCCAATLSHLEVRSEAGQEQNNFRSPAQAIETLWQLDTIGVMDESHEGSDLTVDERSAIRQFNEGLSREDDHYTVTFPKRDSIVELQNNQSIALDRLRRKIGQLVKVPEKYKRYHSEIMKFVEEGHAFEVSASESEFSLGDRSYYMAHREVITKTQGGEKWRIVFDCSSSAQGASSLNDYLLPGPNLNTDLVTMLMNFRLHPIAVSADITKAYMKIGVTKSDQPLFRFLWTAPGESRTRAFQMTKVTWGAASSGFLLAATLREHFRRSDPTSELELGKSFYADDFLRSFVDEGEAIVFVERLREILRNAGMELAKWKTNKHTIRDHLIKSGVDPGAFEIGHSSLFKILGITWATGNDTFTFNFSQIISSGLSTNALTKRTVLRLIASIYDPLGMLLPFTVRGKRIVQKMWSEDLQWDQAVSSEIRSEFVQWITELDTLKECEISRRYGCNDSKAIAYRLHVFADASQLAYACAGYIECRYEDGSANTALVMAKSRLAPRDPPSLPRLELLAALLAVRMKDFLSKRLNVVFEKICLYTDSMITYHWATSATCGRWKTFVANRVAEIQRKSNKEDWFFVPGHHNAADLATRGVSAVTLKQSVSWWLGPSWISSGAEPPTSRPRLEKISLKPVENETRLVVATTVSFPALIDLDTYSSKGRAIRVIANVLRFLYLARRQDVPSVRELHQSAEVRLIKWTQEQFFPEECQAVSAGEQPQRSSRLASFPLFLDEDGLLRAKTRLSEGPVFTYDEKNPIIIPGESRLATLIILEAHRINAHFGVSTILSHVRRRFWVTRARRHTQALLRKCVICRKRQAIHANQIEAPLPRERVSFIHPFHTTGVDFCGPFYIKTKEDTRKAYIVLFTCTAIRAIHLELVPAMSTTETHFAIRRFLSVHPACVRFVSDNGRSFVRAATDIKRLFNSSKNKEVKELLESRSIEWTFLCPRAPWRGGFFERLVGSVKSALYKVLGRSLIGFEEFRTIIAEVAAVINDRPITAVSSDIDGISALTPAHFIHGGNQPAALASYTALDELGASCRPSNKDLQRAYINRTTYFRSLVTRWYREYLLQLKSANTTRGSQAEPIRVGDVCLLKEDMNPRRKWKLIRIEDTHRGRDGLVRTYTVRFPNGTVTRRAAQLLYPLEVVEGPTNSNPQSGNDTAN